MKLVGWSEDHKKYQLKMLLDRNVFQVYVLVNPPLPVVYGV